MAKLSTTDTGSPKQAPTPKQAMRRYFKIFIPSMTSYVIFIFLAAYLITGEHVSGLGLYITALLPAISALAFLYGYFRFIGEMDELARRVQTEAAMVGVATILALTLTWGLLEMFIETLPKLPLFYVCPVYFLVQGVASWRLSKKYGTEFCWL